MEKELPSPLVEDKSDEKAKDPGVIQKQLLDNRFRRLEIIEKIESMKVDKTLDAMKIEEKKLRLEQIKNKEAGFFPPLFVLLEVASAYCVDNSKAYSTDTTLKSIWDEDEMEELKFMIMQKARKL